jgi:hypothetical protein
MKGRVALLESNALSLIFQRRFYGATRKLKELEGKTG